MSRVSIEDANPWAQATQVFAAFTVRLEEGASIQEVIAGHPDLEVPLRRLYSDYLAFGRIKSDIGLGVSFEGSEAGRPDGLQRLNESLRARIAQLQDPKRRLEPLEQIGGGGFGEVYLAKDSLLRRMHARKVLVRPAALARFLEEAQVTAQLSHPGIVPVHDMGIDEQGRPYFSMAYVNGRRLDEIFALASAGEDGWSIARALDALLRVCDTVAYAHARGVIHRDLKPANVMVGKYGDVFVMDWGLARVEGQLEDGAVPDEEDGPDRVSSDRGIGGGVPEARTLLGQALGTPNYMSPEQARGDVAAVGPKSDVYAVGAMLYQLFAGCAPYADEESLKRLGNQHVLALIHTSPPTPLSMLAPRMPVELVAICEKAMARDPAQRYADLGELRDDLRAYLDHRVVRALDNSPLTRVKKWVARNRALAASLSAAVLLLVAGLITSLVFAGQARRQRDGVMRLRAGQDLEVLERRAKDLHPPHPDRIDAMRSWLAEASPVVEALVSVPGEAVDGHYALLETLRSRGRPIGDNESEASEPASEGVERVDGDGTPDGAADVALHGPLQRIRSSEARIARSGTSWEFEADGDRWWHSRLQELVRNLLQFSDPDHGLFGGGDAITPDGFWSVRKRLSAATVLREDFADGGRLLERWRDAHQAILARYGFELPVQMGLVPLGEDPHSGLWEFWHVLSGSEPARVDGTLRLTADSGIILVLIPGGPARVGAQNAEPDAPYYDEKATSVEVPVLELELPPYFLAKYETTQAQWLRLCGQNPSQIAAGATIHGNDEEEASKVVTRLHPVEQVSYNVATALLSRFALRLPNEAEWEVGARGGTDTTFWSGRDIDSLEGAVNTPDARTIRHLGLDWPSAPWDDGWSMTAPVGSYRPNSFGLYDVSGNVCEWCTPQAERTSAASPRQPVLRGGSWMNDPNICRIAYRWLSNENFLRGETGVRACRSVEGL